MQCTNLIAADIQIPSNNDKGKESRVNKEKYFKIIDYVLEKMKFVI